MAYLKNKETGRIITRYVSFRDNEERVLTIQTALDGTEYLTRFGKPVRHYELELYLDDKGKELLLAAADMLALLEISARQGTFEGRIISLSEFEILTAHHFKVEATLSSESEVVDR